MNSAEDNSDGLIHPAFSARRTQISAARQMQISQATATAQSTLANTATSLGRIAAATATFPEVAQIASAVKPGLIIIVASLQRWTDGEIPTAAEVDAVALYLQVIHVALSTAREFCTGSPHMPKDSPV